MTNNSNSLVIDQVTKLTNDSKNTKVDQVIELSADLSNWVTTVQLNEKYPQFSAAQLKTLFWKRREYKGLSSCFRRIGRKGYVCLPLFGLWLAGKLPEQMEGQN